MSIKKLYGYVQEVLPQIYDESLSYMEMLSKVMLKINELVDAYNELPNELQEIVTEYLQNSEEIQSAIATVLANSLEYVINVKMPPDNLTAAKGDGVTDDSTAINAIINYAVTNNYNELFFPTGVYIFNSSVNTQGVYMNGSGYNAVILKPVQNIVVSGTNTKIENLTISDELLTDEYCMLINGENSVIDIYSQSSKLYSVGDVDNLILNINGSKKWLKTTLQYGDVTDSTYGTGYIKALDNSGNEIHVLTGEITMPENYIYVSELRAENPSYNDYELLTTAIDKARENNGLIIWDTSKLDLSNATDIIRFSGMRGIDFNGATVEYSEGMPTPIFQISPSGGGTLTDDYNNYTNNRILNSELYNSFVYYHGGTDQCFGNRYGTADESLIYYRQGFITDSNGYIINDCLHYLPTSNPTIIYRSLENTTLEFKNLNFTTSYVGSNLINVARCNTKISNVNIDITTTATENYQGIICLNAVCYCEIEHCIFANSGGGSISGYAINLLNACSDCYIHDCIGKNASAWGVVAGEYLTNLTIERCCWNRTDVHYMSFGRNSVRDCTLCYSNYPSCGFGTWEFNNNKYIAGLATGYCIYERQDVPGFFNGNVRVINCCATNYNSNYSYSYIWLIDNNSTQLNATLSNTNTVYCSRLIDTFSSENSFTDIFRIGCSEDNNVGFIIKNCDVTTTSSTVGVQRVTTTAFRKLIIDNCVLPYNIVQIECVFSSGFIISNCVIYVTRNLIHTDGQACYLNCRIENLNGGLLAENATQFQVIGCILPSGLTTSSTNVGYSNCGNYSPDMLTNEIVNGVLYQ